MRKTVLLLALLLLPTVLGYEVSIQSPLPGEVVRGSKVSIIAKVTSGNDLVTNATVTARLPNNDYLILNEESNGFYSKDYTISLNDSVGIWVLEVLARKDVLSANSSTNMIIKPSNITVSLISPKREVYSIGEDVNIIIELKYVNNEPVLLPNINVKIGNNNLTLESKGLGIYSGNYYVSNKDNDLLLNILVIDNANNIGTKTYAIAVSGISILYYFKTYPYITWPIIIGLIILIVIITSINSQKKSVKKTNEKIQEINVLKKKAQEDYFINKTMSKEQYDELMIKYNSKLSEIKKKQ